MECPLANGSASNGHLVNGVHKPAKTKRTFTGEELAALNRRDNAHVAVHGKVYDVSSFVEKHPGGPDQIALGAGRDISQLFESYHSEKAFKILEKFHVGDLVSNEWPVFPPRGEFYRTLKQRVDRYFKDHNLDPKYDPWMFVRYAFFLGFAFFCTFTVMHNHENMPFSFLMTVLWGFDVALVAMTFTHDSSHFSITHKPWVWRVFGSVHDLFHGASIFMWIHQHTMGHHPFTNIDGRDPDIATHGSKPDLRRIKHQQPWIPRYLYQHIYVPLVYCFLGLKTRFQDFLLLKSGRNSAMALTIPTYSQLIQFYTGKFLHLNYRFTLLYLYMPLWKVILFNFIAEFVGSYWLALVFQTSHVISEVEWPQPDENNELQRDWAELQVATTQDYATDSWFWSVFTGSLNHQTVHHLFPGILQSHYIKLTPILRDTCREFGVTYHCVPTFWEALGCHINHLKRLGQEDTRPKQN